MGYFVSKQSFKTTDTGKPLKSEPAQEKWFRQTIHTYRPYWFAWAVTFMMHILSVMTT